jgi:hypothetical protein
MKFFGILLFAFLTGFGHAQISSKDTVIIAKNDSIKNAKELRKKTYSMPRRVTLMSAILPGLGQVYNKHYWKVPVIYAGIGGFSYMFIVNNREFKYYRENLRAIYDENPNTENITGYSPENVQLQKVAYRKRRDMAGIGIGIFYLINIIDANVSAHLKTFDVSDDLSLHLDPSYNMYRTASGGYASCTGLSLTLKFK